MSSFKNLTKKQKVGTVLVYAVGIMLVFSSIFMITQHPKEVAELAPLKLGNLIVLLGIIKLSVGLGLLFPKTRHIAALVGTGYLGGAIMANITLGEIPPPAALFGIILWIGMELRTNNFLKFYTKTGCNKESKVCETCTK